MASQAWFVVEAIALVVVTCGCSGSDGDGVAPVADSVASETAADTAVDDGSAPDTSTTPDVTTSDVPAVETALDGAVSCSGKKAMGSTGAMFAAKGQPTLPIDIVWNGCPNKATVTAGTPFASWTLDVGSTNGYFKTNAAGFHTTLTAEIDTAIFSASPPIFLQIVKELPGFDAAKAHVVVSLGTAKAPCTKTGAVVTAPGHAEAKIAYLDKMGAVRVGATSMDTAALAAITNLDPSVSPTLEPKITEVSGCAISFTWSTPRVPLVVNTVSVMNAEAK